MWGALYWGRQVRDIHSIKSQGIMDKVGRVLSHQGVMHRVGSGGYREGMMDLRGDRGTCMECIGECLGRLPVGMRQMKERGGQALSTVEGGFWTGRVKG